MNKKDFFDFAKDFFNQCLRISEKKNADYTGGDTNPFSNFQSVEVLGISTEQGFLTRMMDKMKRIASFVELGTLQVNDESVTDTLRDLANYSCLMAAYIQSKKGSLSLKDFVELTGVMEAAAGSTKIPPIDKPMREFSKEEKDELMTKFNEPGLTFTKSVREIVDEAQNLRGNSLNFMYEGAQNAYSGPKLKGYTDELRKYPFAPDECQESPAVSLQNTKDVFIPSENTETGRTTIGLYNGIKAVMTPNGKIWPYLMSDDLGNGPGNPAL